MTVKELRDKLNKIDNTEILDKEIYLALEDRIIAENIVSLCKNEFVENHDPDEADLIFEEICDQVSDMLIGKLTSCLMRRYLFDVDYYDTKVCFLSESDY